MNLPVLGTEYILACLKEVATNVLLCNFNYGTLEKVTLFEKGLKNKGRSLYFLFYVLAVLTELQKWQTHIWVNQYYEPATAAVHSPHSLVRFGV